MEPVEKERFARGSAHSTAARYLSLMGSDRSREVAVLDCARKALQSRGDASSAELITAVWEVCFGGCGFNMTDPEISRSYEVSKLLFCDPSSVRMMIAKVSQRISDPILRDELRKLSKSPLAPL
jgi:hypothetical protein